MNVKEGVAVVLVLAMICTLIGFAYHERKKSDDAYSRGYSAAADSCRAAEREALFLDVMADTTATMPSEKVIHLAIRWFDPGFRYPTQESK